MWPVTDAYLAALTSAARSWSTRVEVLYGGDFVTTFDVVASGSVSIDDVAVRRSADVDLLDVAGTLTPVFARDLLAPKGTELRLARGLRLADGSTEWVPLGVFGITEPEVSAHDGATRITLQAKDRVEAVKARRFDAPYPVPVGTPTTDAIVDIVTTRLDVPTRVVTTGHTTPEVVFEELSDPWDAVQDLAVADSLRAYFDPLGTFVVEPAAPVATGVTYTGGVGGMLVSARRSMKADRTYSGVIVTGEHPDHPGVRAELWDTDPDSTTYSDGPFGRRPYGYASPLLTSNEMAVGAAATVFSRVTGMREQAEILTVGHLGHEVDDVIEIRDEASSTFGTWSVRRGSIPLRPGRVRLVAERWTEE